MPRVGCDALEPRIAAALSALDSLTEAAASLTLAPDAPILDRLEDATFQLGPMVAACPENVQRYLVRVAQIRSIVKDPATAALLTAMLGPSGAGGREFRR